MARWSYSPKHKVKKVDAHSTISMLASLIETGASTNASSNFINVTTERCRIIAALFVPVDEWSKETRDKMNWYYRQSSSAPTQLYIFQLNNKRVLVK